MGDIIYSTIVTATGQEQEPVVEWYNQSRAISFLIANEALDKLDLVMLDASAGLSFKQADGAVNDIPLGVVRQEVVTDNSQRAEKIPEVGDRVTIFPEGIFKLTVVEGTVNTGDLLIASDNATYAGGVKAKGVDTTHPTWGMCLQGNAAANGTIWAYINVGTAPIY